jgi:hypothetical protein
VSPCSMPLWCLRCPDINKHSARVARQNGEIPLEPGGLLATPTVPGSMWQEVSFGGADWQRESNQCTRFRNAFPSSNLQHRPTKCLHYVCTAVATPVTMWHL